MSFFILFLFVYLSLYFTTDAKFPSQIIMLLVSGLFGSLVDQFSDFVFGINVVKLWSFRVLYFNLTFITDRPLQKSSTFQVSITRSKLFSMYDLQYSFHWLIPTVEHKNCHANFVSMQ